LIFFSQYSLHWEDTFIKSGLKEAPAMPGVSLLPPPWNLVTTILLLAIGVLLLCGFALFPYGTSRMGRLPKHLQLPQSLLLAAWAFIVWRTSNAGTAPVALGLTICSGITLGFLGDLFMANVFGQNNHVLLGMGAFAAGHICYMLGFRQIALKFGLHAAGSYAIALAGLWLIALLFWQRFIRTPDDDAMQVAALVYALFLASMTAYACGLALQHGAFWPLAGGAVLFLFSDMLIAANMFGKRTFRSMGDLIWLTYIAGQTLIVTVLPVAFAP
jgi:hypothetical protein